MGIESMTFWIVAQCLNKLCYCATKSFANGATFKYLGTLKNQNCIHEEIKRRVKSGNVLSSKYSVFPPEVLYIDIKIKT
jgi:hypothetical protein